MIDTRDIAVVLQGHVPAPDTLAGRDLRRLLRQLRRLLPHSPLHLGTWDGCATDAALYDADQLALAADPGALPPFKHSGTQHPNNVNRQLVGSNAVLRGVDLPYTLKLGLDSDITTLAFLSHYARHGRAADGHERIAVAGFSTLDPRMFEHMPFHVSDCFAFGPSASVQALWSAPPMTAGCARHYDANAHAAGSSFFDRRHRARFAAEQYIAIHYASRLGYRTPRFHNDASPAVLASHDHFIARELLLLDASACGIALPGHAAASRSSQQHLGCLNFLDWYLLSRRGESDRTTDKTADPALLAAAARRAAAKRRVRIAARLAEPLMALLTTPPVKASLSALLRASMRLD